MSNDLLFPILPRNTKVRVETDERVKKVQKTKKSEHVTEEDSDQFQEVKHAEAIERVAKHINDQERDLPTEQDGLKHIDIDV